MTQTRTSGRYATATGRWAGFGPYYAMFPVPFAQEVVTKFCPKGGKILDPFCGRGTAPFLAQSAGIHSLGIDSNPVAWVFAKAKTQPEKNVTDMLTRVGEVWEASTASDAKSSNEFQKWAWHPEVLRFLNSARRELDWRKNKTDRTLMAFILSQVHSKLGDGISNQMMKSRALGPDYSVRWWKKKKMKPPNINSVDYFEKRIKWRYLHGTVARKNPAEIILGNAEEELCRRKGKKIDLLFTSPPYLDVTSYRHDSWIRLWVLGEGPARPDWIKDKKIHKPDLYQKMLESVLTQSKRLLKPNGTVWIRTDARKFTKETTRNILGDLWGGRYLYEQSDIPEKTQTSQYGRITRNLGEIDFLISTSPQKAKKLGFEKYKSTL